MVNTTQQDGAPGVHPTEPVGERDLDVLVLGATGVTGRCVVRRLAHLDTTSDVPLGRRRWAVAGRSRDRLERLLEQVGAPDTTALTVDVHDTRSLAAAAARTRVLLNMAGPYTPTAEAIIRECITAGTSYVDVSGELPLLHRVNKHLDAPAGEAGVQVVQMAGWEAMPADVVTLLACRSAAEAEGTPRHEQGTIGPDGPGAGEGVATVDVEVTFEHTPAGRVPLSESVSGGTLASITTQLGDPDARVVGDPAGLLPVPAPGSSEGAAPSAAAAVRSRSPLRLRPRTRRGHLIGPAVPVAFLNPPVIHRTAGLLAAENARAHVPAVLREGVDHGAAHGRRSLRTRLRLTVAAAAQRALLALTRLPQPLRRTVTALAGTLLPEPGSGPTGAHLDDWAWSITGHAVSTSGTTGTATLHGTGHPGYTATGSIATAVALHLARTPATDLRTGCLTPALALDTRGARTLRTPELHLVDESPRTGSGERGCRWSG